MSIKKSKLSLTLILMMIAATLLIFVPAQAQNTDSVLVTTSPGATITNAAPTTSTINVANAETISSMTVTVSIAHSHGGDLRIALRHAASGRSVTLLNGLNLAGYIYGCGATAITAAFNDGAGMAMDNFDCSSDFNMPVTGVYRPSEGLATFNGVSMAGDWVLEVNDRLPSDDGVLNAWAITFNDAVAGAPAPAPVAIPVIGGRPAPLCSDFDGSTNPVVRAVFPNGSENVFCRVIQANGEYVISESEIGSKAVLDHEPVQAVEVYTLNNSQENAYGGQICLEGYAGGILFLDARDAPRVPTWLRSTQNRGYTCTFIPAEGTVVLAEIGFDGQAVDFVGNDDDDTDDVDSDDTDTRADDVTVTSGEVDMRGVELDNCEVITQDILNLRTAPGLNSNVIDLVPFDLTLTATARSGDWIRVIYLDGQGWLNEGYLFTRGNCDG